MKTIKNKYPLIYSFENLLKSHRFARRGKRHKKEIILFETELNYHLINLKKELETKTYKMGDYRIFKVYEPKERIIMSLPYRDRIVQHAICDYVLEPFLDKMLIYDNCASRKGKGTHFGLNRLETFLKQYYNKRGTSGYILKGDISKYFYNIHHKVLKQNLYRYIKDDDLIWILDLIIDSTEGEVGIPIGNMTSQWFAVFYLHPLDQLIKEKLKIKYYSRYMDDFVLIHEDKQYLKHCLKEIQNLLQNDLKLELNNKTQIFPLKNGVDYLGFHTYLTEQGKVIRKIRRSSKKRMKRKIKKFKEKYKHYQMDFKDIKSSIASWLGHAKHGDTYHLQKSILKKCIFRRESNEKKSNSYNNDTNDANKHHTHNSDDTKHCNGNDKQQ